jgi:hypothetical protein
MRKIRPPLLDSLVTCLSGSLEDGMNFLRIATLLVVCGVALTTVAKSKTLQESASKPVAQQDDVPKSIANSVSYLLRRFNFMEHR